MRNSFYTKSELKSIGFKSIGQEVLISRKASIYSPEQMTIGDNVRIDDFCILSGKILIGSNIHISAYVALYGSKGIELDDYSGLSPKVSVFSAMDDFSGNYLVGPIHKAEFTNVTGGVVHVSKFCQIGANSILFPNIIIGEGCAVGAFSLVNKNLDSWGIYVGIPVRRLKERSRQLLNLIK